MFLLPQNLNEPDHSSIIVLLLSSLLSRRYVLDAEVVKPYGCTAVTSEHAAGVMSKSGLFDAALLKQ